MVTRPRCGVTDLRLIPFYLGGVEIAGLILAMVATALVAYALPSWVDRRYAIVTSREGDRFSGSLTLLTPTFRKVAPVEEPSSRPLLARTSSPAMTGTQMSEPMVTSRPAPKGERPQGRVLHQEAAREYAALKARRASRVSVETAAANRRMVTAAVGSGLTVLFVILAAVGVLMWAWVLLPLGFLAGSLASSVLAGSRAKKTAETEDARLVELRAELNKSAPLAEGRPMDADRTQVRARQTSGRSDGGANIGLAEVSFTSDEVTSARLAESLRSQAGNVTATKLEDPRELAAASGGEWDYVPMPGALHAKRTRVRNRVVHTHTDIVGPHVSPQSAAVPGRPVRATKTPMTIEEIETSSNPTFRFDLDAVLDQRRAQ